jgi:hypothetical protein
MALGVDYTSGCGYINAAGNGDLQPVCLQTRGGKVGIGTQNPQATLDVYAAGTGATPQINVTSYAGGFTTTNTSALNLKIQGAGGGMVDNTIKSKYYSDSGGTYGFEFNSSGTNLMNLNGTGIYLFAPNGSSSGLFNMHKYFGTGSSSLNIFSVAISGTNSYGSCHLEIIYVGTSNGKAGYSVKVECAIVDNYGVTPQTQVYQNTTLIASGGGALSGTLVGAPSGGPGTLYSSVSSRTCTFYFSGLPTSNAIDVYVRAMVGGASGYPSNAGYYTFAWL